VVLFSVWLTDSFLLQSVHTESGDAHCASHLMGAEFLGEVKWGTAAGA
jgi:hypothetical protein